MSSYYYFSSSLTQLLFKFGLGFPHDRFPFCSGQKSCFPSLYSHSPQVHFDIINRPLLMSSFSPTFWFAFQKLHYSSYTSIRTTGQSRSNLCTLLQVKYLEIEIHYKFLYSFLFPSTYFHMLAHICKI